MKLKSFSIVLCRRERTSSIAGLHRCGREVPAYILQFDCACNCFPYPHDAVSDFRQRLQSAFGTCCLVPACAPRERYDDHRGWHSDVPVVISPMEYPWTIATSRPVLQEHVA